MLNKNGVNVSKYGMVAQATKTVTNFIDTTLVDSDDNVCAQQVQSQPMPWCGLLIDANTFGVCWGCILLLNYLNYRRYKLTCTGGCVRSSHGMCLR